jgi:hypothetical protein
MCSVHHPLIVSLLCVRLTGRVVVAQNQRPVVVVALLVELAHRDGLRAAVSGRDDVGLEPLLRFLVRHVTNPRYARALLDVCAIVLDVYTPVVGQSLVVDELLARLRLRLRQEVAFQHSLQSLLGTLDLLFASATAAGRLGDAVPLGAVADAADEVEEDAHKDDDDDSDQGDADGVGAPITLPDGELVSVAVRPRRGSLAGATDEEEEEDEDEDEDEMLAALGGGDGELDDDWVGDLAATRRGRRLRAATNDDDDDDEEEKDDEEDEDEDEDLDEEDEGTDADAESMMDADAEADEASASEGVNGTAGKARRRGQGNDDDDDDM